MLAPSGGSIIVYAEELMCPGVGVYFHNVGSKGSRGQVRAALLIMPRVLLRFGMRYLVPCHEASPRSSDASSTLSHTSPFSNEAVKHESGSRSGYSEAS